MASKKPNLQAQPRTLTGKKVNQLRRQHILPANIFGKKIKSQAIQLDLQEFNRVYSEAGETTLVDLVIDSTNRPTLITNVQLDPITSTPLHADFHQVDLTEKVTANIPLEIVGESPAVKDKGGVLETPLTEIEVEALPTDLPDNIQVDISILVEIGDTLSVSDLKVDSKVEIKSDPQAPIVVISEPREEESEPVVVEPEAETGKEHADAEGESKPATDTNKTKTDEGGEKKQSE